MDQLITLVQVLPFALLFAAALWTALRKRDPLARDLCLVFSPLAATFAAEIWILTEGPLATVAGEVLIALILAQPVLTLRLVADVRQIPRWMLPSKPALRPNCRPSPSQQIKANCCTYWRDWLERAMFWKSERWEVTAPSGLPGLCPKMAA